LETKVSFIRLSIKAGKQVMPTYWARSHQHHDFATRINTISCCNTLHYNWSCW